MGIKLKSIKALALLVEERDPYTAGHQQRVAGLVHSIAIKMGLPAERQELTRVAGLFEDSAAGRLEWGVFVSGV